jgi:ADP-heptose:LPS heptosyltransferase
MSRIIKSILWAAYSLAITFLFRIVFFFSPPKHVDGGKKRVLFLKFDGIGDFILWLDTAKELRKIFPAERFELVLLGTRAWTSFAEKLPYFDEVWSLDRPRFLFNPVYRLKILIKIRRFGFDTVVLPSYSREFLFGDFIVRFSGAKERIGSEGDCSNIMPFLKRISDRWYTRLVPAGKEPLMELERNAEFLRGMGMPGFRSGVPSLTAFGRPSVDIPHSGYYVLFPGAGMPIKQWPAENFVALADRIHRATGWTGLVCGGPGEENLGEALVKGSGVPLETRIGRTSLEDLISIVAGARLMVGNDTSAIHIAAAVSTPSVCILGGGHHGRFMPYKTETETISPLPVPVVYKMDCFQCRWTCVYHLKEDEPAPCIRNIAVDAVWEKVGKILGRNAH